MVVNKIIIIIIIIIIIVINHVQELIKNMEIVAMDVRLYVVMMISIVNKPVEVYRGKPAVNKFIYTTG